MSTKRKWLLIGALSILSAGVIGVGAYFTKKSTPVVEAPEGVISEEPISEISPTPEINTSDWKTYRNEEFGFEFQYPRIYDEIKYNKICGIKEFNKSIAIGSLIKLQIKNYKESNTLGYNDEDIEEFLKLFPYIIPEKKSIIVGGKEALQVSYNSYNRRVYLIKDGKTFVFNIFGVEAPRCEFRYGPNESNYISEPNVFDQMISTFTFLK